MNNEEKPIVLEMADNMVKIETGMNKLLASGLTEAMIVTLVRDITKVSKTDIRKVIDGLNQLESELNKNRTQFREDSE